MSPRKTKSILIDSKTAIPPSFPSEDAEREWWASHDFSDAYYAEADADPMNHILTLEHRVRALLDAVDRLADENRGLKDRLEKIEARLG